jgi:hypothetical protein
MVGPGGFQVAVGHGQTPLSRVFPFPCKDVNPSKALRRLERVITVLSPGGLTGEGESLPTLKDREDRRNAFTLPHRGGGDATG